MAYAIIKTGGRQYRVSEGDTIDVDLLEGDAGRKMTFGDVLMHADGEKFTHGSPSVSGASVTGEVVDTTKDAGKGDKAAAKSLRDALNKASESTRWHVTPGPDHRNFKE